MSMRFEPEDYVEDQVANALLNIAAEINRLASATNGLLYGLKYGKDQGMSIAEAIEVAGRAIASGIVESNQELIDSRQEDE